MQNYIEDVSYGNMLYCNIFVSEFVLAHITFLRVFMLPSLDI